MTWARSFVKGLVVLWLALCAGGAISHEMSMAELDMRETAKGQFIWSWGQSGTNQPIATDLTPVWPEGCIASAEELSLKCPAAGMVGTLAVEGVGKRYSAAMVRVVWLDGQSRVYTITTAQPSVYLYGAADDQRGWKDIVVAYTALGVEHILSGIDHLMFVMGLLFLVGFNRRLVGTITAFTVAHSLTLASSVMGWLTLRSAPVEASIALSIVLVASEALNPRATLARRLPALVAFLFGLVHGLGFAGALKEIGLPESHLPLALLTFNVGVEIGQLFAVGVAWGLTRWLSRYAWFARARKPALYVIGATAAYWSWLRIAAIAG
jgi:hypothetical protein